METVPSRQVPFAETVEKVEFDPAMHTAPLPVVEHIASASTMAHRVPETTMTLSATTSLVHAAVMEENGLISDEIKLVMLHGNCSWSDSVCVTR